MPAKKQFLVSFKIALRGLLEASLGERNLKIQWGIASIVVTAGLFFQLTVIEWCLLVFSIGGVLSAETMNTAIESLVDLLEPDQHESARKAKDFAAGSVLVFSIVACVIGLLIFGNHILLVQPTQQ